jgi:hypothetical protein
MNILGVYNLTNPKGENEASNRDLDYGITVFHSLGEITMTI